MGAFLPFSGGMSQALQLPAAAGSTWDPSSAGVGDRSPLPRVSFTREALKAQAPGDASRVRGGMPGKGRGGQMLAEPGSAPAPLPPAPGFAGRGQSCLGCLARVAAPRSRAGLRAPPGSGAQRCPPGACHSRHACLQGTGPKRVPHPCRGPSQPRPGPGLGRGGTGWMGVEEGPCSFGAQLWGQGAWAHILILPLPPSLSCCYLDLGLFLIFPASSSMGRRRRPPILPSHHQAQLPQASQAV